MVLAVIELALVGLCLGSFANAFVYRFHRQQEIDDQLGLTKVESRNNSVKKKKLQQESEKLSITKGRSLCPHCGHELAPRDLIPVLSYVWLRGRCRYCHYTIDDTPLPELLTPLLFLVSYVSWPYGFHGSGLMLFGFWLVFLVGFVVLTLYDLRWYLLPDRLVLPLVGLAGIEVALQAIAFHGGLQVLLEAVYGALAIGGLFYVLHTVSKGTWIGGGDVTLGVLLGLIVGGPGHGLLLIFLASLIGTMIALPLLATGRASRSTHLPFGPFLMAAAVIVQLWGGRLIDLYSRYLLGS